MAYLSTDTKGEYDLTTALYRAGVRLFWDFQTGAYKVESHYVSRFSASGDTEDQALEMYGLKIQEAQNWQSVAQELLGAVKAFIEFLSECANDDEIAQPGYYWDCVLIPAFEKAYQEPKDLDGIRRIYAFAEWCHSQNHAAELDGYHLPTTVLINFYERIPEIPGALEEMPNWFVFEEYGWLLNTSFMQNSRESVLRVFGRNESRKRYDVGYR